MAFRLGAAHVIILVMQTLDNALRFRASRSWFGRGVSLATEQDEGKPNPTYIDAGNRAALWLAKRTGGVEQSMLLEALANIPSTAHILGGAVIGRDTATGVVDSRHRLFGYENLLVMGTGEDAGLTRRRGVCAAGA